MIHWLESHLINCFFKSQFGIECPGCGMQRAFISLLKGNLSESFANHPALIPFLITLIALILQIKFNTVNGGKIIVVFFIITSFITVINYILKFI